jgi:hypothetical protein
MKRKLTTQQIGKCGELLVQYHLLQNGVESAPMTTDSGIDLVAYSAKGNKAITIQVKTNQKPKPGGGKGRPSIDWWVPQDSNAELFAFVDLSQEQIWVVKNKEMESLAQQKPKGRYHFFMVIDPDAKDRKDKKKFRIFEFEKYKLENRIHSIFM